MSTADLVRASPGAADVAVRSRVSSRFLRSELRLVFRRRRNIAMLVVLASAPLLLGIAITLSSSSTQEQGGPAFIGQITENGLFLGFTSLIVTLTLFLPLAVAVASGESIAGEAATGTLRNLLVVPAGRTRLLLVKYTVLVVWACACAVTVAAVGILVGIVLFPTGPVTLVSGDVVPFVDALGRAGLVALYVSAMLAGVAAIGLFISTLTEVPLGAMAATVVLTIVSEILDSVPQVHVIHPYLFTHRWLAFGDLIRSPITLHEIGLGLLTQVVYIALFWSAAWARFGARDVTS